MQPARYLPTWESLASRPCPTWYREAKLGVMLHWGPYSVPAFDDLPSIRRRQIANGSEWYYHRLMTNWRNEDNPTKRHHQAYYPTLTYEDFADHFRAENWRPQEWADFFYLCGAKYVVITAKHHDGFCLWPTNAVWRPSGRPWSAGSRGPKRDLLGELTVALRNRGLRVGFYYSWLQWDRSCTSKKYLREVVQPQLQELVQRYLPDLLWFDGDWLGSAEHWQSREFLAWLYNDSPVRDRIVVNDRLGKDLHGLHGDFRNHRDRFVPEGPLDHPWECVMTLSASWGHMRGQPPEAYKTGPELLALLHRVISLGGNLLLNFGPDASGQLDPGEVAALWALRQLLSTT